MTIEEIKKRYVELCSECCQTTDDYTPDRVKRHNKAMKKKLALAQEINANPLVAAQVFGDLLNHEDIHVKGSAAGQCLKYGFHIKKAQKILKRLSKSKNKLVAGESEMALEVWRATHGD